MRDLEMPIAKEQGVSVVILRNAMINASQLKNVINKYMQPSMLPRLLKLDMTNNRIGEVGSDLLAQTFKQICNLVHLSLADNKLGDMSIKRIVGGLIAGGGNKYLTKLDLRGNEMTLSGGVSSLLSRLSELRVLDLSYNSINVEGKSAKKQMTDLLKPLTKLEVFSLAFNRLHDSGCGTLFTLLAPLKELTIVDFSHCFLTNKSVEAIKKYLTSCSTKQILLSGLVCDPENLKDVKKYAASLSKQLFFEESNPGIELLESFRTE